MSSQLETNLVSVERVKEYSDAQTEVGENEIIDHLNARRRKRMNLYNSCRTITRYYQIEQIFLNVSSGCKAITFKYLLIVFLIFLIE